MISPEHWEFPVAAAPPLGRLTLAGRLSVPDETEALIIELDGVLLDLRSHDHQIVNQALHDRYAGDIDIPREVVQANSGQSAAEFWRRILAAAGITLNQTQTWEIIHRYDELRLSAPPRVHRGIVEVLTDAEYHFVNIAVVSAMSAGNISLLLAKVGLRDRVDEIVGNDIAGMTDPPAPDRYLEAARRLEARPANCVALVDSLLGAEAAARAGCYPVGIATGGNSFDELAESLFTADDLPDLSQRAPMTRVRIPPWILAAQPYPSERSDSDRPGGLRLDRNESTYPIPESVAAALTEHVLGRGERDAADLDRLVASLAEYCGVAEDFILPTSGADQAIDLTLRSFLRAGRRMLVAQPEYPVYGHVAALAGAEILGIPHDQELRFPCAQFRAAAAEGRPDLIVLTNPNTLTGAGVDREFIAELVQDHQDVPVLVDETYHEFTGETVVELTAAQENLIVVRSFSHAFAMAGLRLGYVVASPLAVRQLAKLRNPFDISDLAVVAARANLADLDSVRADWAETMTVVKPMVVAELRELGLEVLPGRANFVLVRPAGCADLVELLRKEKILVRPLHGPVLDGMFRMTLGSWEEAVHAMAVCRAAVRGGRTD
ncbi:aminotransferase class I/II-fold pyridoxal phosphate-dependent enzyme [Nocardia colli]|nr:aminotransferase class I/II-fold pyridoxal phosphate-dependent enzyme [Nocardia colli]